MDKLVSLAIAMNLEAFSNHFTGVGFIGTKILKHLSSLILLFLDLRALNRFF